DGRTALHAAVVAAHAGDGRVGARQVVKALLVAGADADAKDNAGATPLDLAVEADGDAAVRLLLLEALERSR
ncbi:hypothetical protein TSOC_015488, partial [Tetrabaena socialis]